jgi:hypothetical protein
MIQGRQDCCRRCPLVQSSPRNGLAATRSIKFEEGQPRQIACKVLRQTICKVTGDGVI